MTPTTKITFFESITDPNKCHFSEVQSIIETIKHPSEKLENEIEALRKAKDENVRRTIKINLPIICWSGEFKKRNSAGLTQYSNLVCLDFDKLGGYYELKERQKKLINDPFVFCSFISPSGTGLKVICKVEGDSNNHLDNFLALASYFSNAHSIIADPSGKDLARACFVSVDRNLHYNPASTVFPLSKSKEILKRETFSDLKSPSNKDPLQKRIDCMLVWWLKNYTYQEGARNNTAFILASSIVRAGADQATIEQIVINNCPGLDSKELNTIVLSAMRSNTVDNTFNSTSNYLKPSQSLDVGNKKPSFDLILIDSKKLTTSMVKSLIKKKNLIFRFNEISQRQEISFNNTPFVDFDDNKNLKLWSEIDADLKTNHDMKRDLNQKILDASILDLSYSFHPIKSFFGSEKWDGKPRLDTFLTHFTDAHAASEQYLTMYLFGSLERLFTGYQNPVLILDGVQKMGKSFFSKWLCSPFSNYYRGEGHIDPANKDSKLELANNFVFEWGEARGFSKREVESLKSLIFSDEIIERLPYGRVPIRRPFLANIIMTKNSSNGGFLKDLTGNRRFNTLFLIGINQEYSKINCSQLWLEIFDKWQKDTEKTWQNIDQQLKTAIDDKALDAPHIWSVLDKYVEVGEGHEEDLIPTYALYAFLSHVDKHFNHNMHHTYVTSWFIKNGSDKDRKSVEGQRLLCYTRSALTTKALEICTDISEGRRRII